MKSRKNKNKYVSFIENNINAIIFFLLIIFIFIVTPIDKWMNLIFSIPKFILIIIYASILAIVVIKIKDFLTKK